MVFRIGYEPFTLVLRLVFTCLFLGVVFITPAASPKEKVDKSWLISFCIVMMIYFTCLHAFAYFPTALFGNFPHCLESAMNMSHSDGLQNNVAPNQRSYAYCTAILALLLVIWPLLTFAFLIKQGFDPYEDLSKKEWTVAGGSFSPFLWTGRTVCHFFLTFMTGYLIALWAIIIIVRNVQKHGDKAWIAQRIGSMPFGSVFFQEGLYFDCGICLQGFWANEEIICLACSELHVFHPKCLKNYLSSRNQSECNLCLQPLKIAEPDDRELIDNEMMLDSEN